MPIFSINWCANAVQHNTNEQDQINIFRINESRPASKFCNVYQGTSLSWVKQGVEVRLHCFNPMDMEALGMTQHVMKELLIYYPLTDDTIHSLDESLSAHSFSWIYFCQIIINAIMQNEILTLNKIWTC